MRIGVISFDFVTSAGMEIQFLVARTGSKSNPQNKIISSLAQVTAGDWIMKYALVIFVASATTCAWY
jgi:hypothetical protein